MHTGCGWLWMVVVVGGKMGPGRPKTLGPLGTRTTPPTMSPAQTRALSSATEMVFQTRVQPACLIRG